MMQPLLRHQIYDTDKSKTFSESDECEVGNTNHLPESENEDKNVEGKQKEKTSEDSPGEDQRKIGMEVKKLRINNELLLQQKKERNGKSNGNDLQHVVNKKPSEKSSETESVQQDDVQSDISERSEVLNVDEESNQSEHYEKQFNVSPVDLTNRNLELERNRFKFNTLLLRNRTIFNNCTDFLNNGRENINFFDGAARFQLKEDNYDNSRINAPFFDRRLEKDFVNVSDRFFKIEDVRNFNNDKLFLSDGKMKEIEETRSESVNSNLSVSSNQEMTALSSFRRQDDKSSKNYQSDDKMSPSYLSPFQRFSYSPDRKSTSPVGESGQPRRNLAFSVENILDPNKFTGNGPHKMGNGAASLAALVSGQRIPGALGNMVSPVACCWRPQMQDGGESDRDDNSGELKEKKSSDGRRKLSNDLLVI